MANVAETEWRAGIESAHGTPVTATRYLYLLAGIPEEQRPPAYVDQARNNFIAHYEAIQTHALVESIPFAGILAYDDAPWWLQLAVRGGVAATGAGPYVWSFPDNTAVEDLDSTTLEAADNVGAFQLPYAMCTEWSLSGAGGQSPTPINATFNLRAQKLVAGHTLTGSPTDRDLRGNYLRFADAELYLDGTAGAIGTTDISASFVGFEASCNNQLVFEHTGNSLHYTTHRRGKRWLELTLMLLFDATTYAEFSGQFQTGASRYVQINVPGTGNDIFTLNMHAAAMAAYELQADGPTRKVALMGRSAFDPTLGYGFQIQVQNDVASI